ncbi:MAG: hypothetical protein TYPL_0180 [Candidatus Tyloplasma litorale]|nr:MAG: hypothetical protein TYPL_0180 [Mycoplasmatales bacterium]
MYNELLNYYSPEIYSSSNNNEWFLYFSLAIIFLFAISLIIIHLLKGRLFALITSLIFGVFLLILFISIVNGIDIKETNSNVLEQINSIIIIPSYLFIFLITIAIPFYILFVVIEFITSSTLTNIKGRTYLTSFGSLLLLSLFGIIIALLMLPIILLIPNNLFDPNIINGNVETELKPIILWFIDWRVILFILLFSLIFGFVLRISFRKTEKLKNINIYFQRISKAISIYFSWVTKLVPYVILTRMASLGLLELDEASNLFSLMIIYMVIFWFGSIIIFSSLFGFNVFLSRKQLSKKESSKILIEQTLNVFAKQSIQASLPDTQATVRKLGVCEEISKLTPTKGVIMGMVMCNGFTPMLIILFSLMNYEQLTFTSVLITISLVMIFAISTSGQGSADYTIIMTALGIMGLPNAFYTSILLPIQEINESIIAKPNNSLGHIVATQLTEKVHEKLKKENHI